jgi:hypothetical protein
MLSFIIMFHLGPRHRIGSRCLLDCSTLEKQNFTSLLKWGPVPTTPHLALVSGILAQYVVILHAITVQSPQGWTFIDVHRAEALQVLKGVSKVQLSPTVQQTLNPLMLLTLTIQRHSDQFWQIAILSSFRTVRWRRPDEDSYSKYPCFFAKKFGQGTNYPSLCSFSGFQFV